MTSMKKSITKKIIASLIVLTLIIISILIINRNESVDKENQSESRIEQKISKTIKKMIKEDQEYKVNYIEGKKENTLIIKMKITEYKEDEAYKLAKEAIELIDEKYDNKIDNYEFYISTEFSEKVISFDYTRDDLKNIDKINENKFKELATNICNHNDIADYEVAATEYSTITGDRKNTIRIVVPENTTDDQMVKIAEQEVLEYLKDKDEEDMDVAFYYDYYNSTKSSDMKEVDYNKSIYISSDIDIYKEVRVKIDKPIDQNNNSQKIINNIEVSKSEQNDEDNSNNNYNHNSSNTINNSYNDYSDNSSSNKHIGYSVYIANGNRYYHSISNCKYLEGAPTSNVTLTSDMEKFECNCWTNPISYKPPTSSGSESSSSGSTSPSGKTVYIASGNSYYHKSSSCKFLNGASVSAVDLNNVSGKHACNCIKY